MNKTRKPGNSVFKAFFADLVLDLFASGKMNANRAINPIPIKNITTRLSIARM